MPHEPFFVSPESAMTFAGVAGSLVALYAPSPQQGDAMLAATTTDVAVKSPMLLDHARHNVCMAVTGVSAVVYLSAALVALIEMPFRNFAFVDTLLNIVVFGLLVLGTIILGAGSLLLLLGSLISADNSIWNWIASVGSRRIT